MSSIISLLLEWSGICFLVALSGLFAGLTLGLLSLDPVGLEIVIGSGSELDSKYARTIYPLRKRGNLLLCVLLLGNVAVNVLLSILMADKTSGIVGFFVSTGIIVLFGEIIPQSVCSRYGLAVGYYTMWIVWLLLIFLFPISWPISLILDWILGREIGTIYSRKELKKLVEIHGGHHVSDITHAEGTILSGALDFSTKPVSEVMTPLENVFMLEVDQRLDFDTTKMILEQGYSRVPIFEKNPQQIVGLLLVKDLALISTQSAPPIRELLPHFNRHLPRVFDDVLLGDMLKEFKAGRSHMAVVRRIMNEDGPGDPFYENVGVITLEDIIEEIINDEIIDETDIYIDTRSKTTVRGRQLVEYGHLDDEESTSDASTASLVTPHHVGPSTITPDERDRVVAFLSQHVALFSPQSVAPMVLSKLVDQSLVLNLEVGHADNPASLLYQPSKEATFMTLVLRGELQVVTLNNDRYPLRASPNSTDFPILGLNAIKQGTFFPDFTAWCSSSETRILQINRYRYHASLHATTFEVHRPENNLHLLGNSSDDELDPTLSDHSQLHEMSSFSPISSSSSSSSSSSKPAKLFSGLIGKKSTPKDDSISLLRDSLENSEYSLDNEI